MAEMKLGLRIEVDDQASAQVKKVRAEAARSVQDVTLQAVRGATQQQQAAARTATVQQQANARVLSSSQRLAQVRSQLGVRSEHQIQREIQRTIASYNRLRASGTATSRELARAAQAMRTQVTQLNAEMGRTTWGQKLGNFGRGMASVGTGLAVGVNQIAKPIKTTADYNLSLAYLANTAYSDRDTAGRQAGMNNIHQTIKDSVTKYGGSKETAMEALNSMVAQGKMSVDSALSLLPMVQKNATATGASTTDIAGLVNAGLGYGIKEEEIQDFLDYANASGKAGGFELRDMAQYVPSLFAAAKGAGLQGMNGAKEMFKILQQVYNVSGGSSETATNTMNFLSKLNSQDTINRAKKLEIYDPKDKKNHGVDLTQSMMMRMRKGASPIEAFLGIVDNIMAQDRGYQKLQKELNNAKNNSDKEAVLNRLADYMQGTKVGELVADRQAWLGMYGVRSQKLTGENVEQAYGTALGGTDKDWQFIGGQAAIKFQNAENTAEMGKIEAFTGLTEVTGDLAQKLADYGAQYPALTNAIMGTTEALKALGSAAMAMAGVNWGLGLLGGSTATATTVAGTTASTTATTGATTAATTATRAVGVVGTVFMLRGDESQATKEERQKKWKSYEAVRSGKASKEQEKQVYDEHKSVVDKWDQGGWFTRLFMSEGIVDYHRGEMRKYEQKNNIGYSGLTQSFGNTKPWTATVGSAEMGGDVGLSGLSKTLGDLSALSNYQADFQAFGQQISDGLKQAVESQQLTIQNHLTVDLDGREVAASVSENQYQFFKRGSY